MNVYQVNVEPVQTPGSGIGHMGVSRQIVVVTDTLQEAINIVRGKLTGNEAMTGIYELAHDVIVDYSKVIGANC